MKAVNVSHGYSCPAPKRKDGGFGDELLDSYRGKTLTDFLQQILRMWHCENRWPSGCLRGVKVRVNLAVIPDDEWQSAATALQDDEDWRKRSSGDGGGGGTATTAAAVAEARSSTKRSLQVLSVPWPGSEERLAQLIQCVPMVIGFIARQGSFDGVFLEGLPPQLVGPLLSSLLFDSQEEDSSWHDLRLEALRFGTTAAAALLELLQARVPQSLEHVSVTSCSFPIAGPVVTYSTSILRTTLHPHEHSRLRHLKLSDVDLTHSSALEALSWLSDHPTLRFLSLWGLLGTEAAPILATALQGHKCRLQCLELVATRYGGTTGSSRTDHSDGQFGTIGEALAVNQSLERLIVCDDRLSECDMQDIAIGLQNNRALQALKVLSPLLTQAGLQPLMETVLQHRNISLFDVTLPPRFATDEQCLRVVGQFHREFRAACVALRYGPNSGGVKGFRKWWPLLGSNHPPLKSTVVFLLARFQAEEAAQSLRNPPQSMTSYRLASSDNWIFPSSLWWWRGANR